MGKYKEIKKARQFLGLDEYATLKEIKNNYRALLKEWHPDLHKKNKAVRKEKTIEIISAYKTIMDYSSFQYPTVSAVGFPLTPLWKRGAREDF